MFDLAKKLERHIFVDPSDPVPPQRCMQHIPPGWECTSSRHEPACAVAPAKQVNVFLDGQLALKVASSGLQRMCAVSELPAVIEALKHALDTCEFTLSCSDNRDGMRDGCSISIQINRDVPKAVPRHDQ